MNASLTPEQKRLRSYLIAGGTGALTVVAAQPVHAQTAVTVDSVSTQLTSAQSAIVAVGGTLIAMAMGILLFTIGKRIIKRATST